MRGPELASAWPPAYYVAAASADPLLGRAYPVQPTVKLKRFFRCFVLLLGATQPLFAAINLKLA